MLVEGLSFEAECEDLEQGGLDVQLDSIYCALSPAHHFMNLAQDTVRKRQMGRATDKDEEQLEQAFMQSDLGNFLSTWLSVVNFYMGGETFDADHPYFIACMELLMNALEHGVSFGREVVVCAVSVVRKAIIYIEHEGDGFDFSDLIQHPPETRFTDLGQERGHGLSLVASKSLPDVSVWFEHLGDRFRTVICLEPRI